MKRAFVLIGALVFTSCANDAPSTTAVPTGSQVVDVSMTDMAFTPNTLSVPAGETVTFRFRNNGAVKHEAVIGTAAEQDEHHMEMAAAAEGGEGAGGHGGHDMSDLHAVTVEPGQTIELTHTFDAPGQLLLGCHQKGHWEDGMKMTVDITA